MKRKGSSRIEVRSRDEIASLFLPDNELVRGPIPTAVCSLESIAEKKGLAIAVSIEKFVGSWITYNTQSEYPLANPESPLTCARLSLPGWNEVQCRVPQS